MIMLFSIVVTTVLNISIQIVSDRFFDNEIDDLIIKMINEDKKIDRAEVEKMDDIELVGSMIINLISIGFCGILLWIFIRKKTKYIKELSDALIYIGEGNLDYRVPLREDNELTELANSINELSIAFKDRIDKEKEQSVKERDFIMGISHDIRTPLTTIMGYLHIIKDEQYQTTMEKNQYMDTVIEKVDELKGLTDILLDDSNDTFKFYPQSLMNFDEFFKKTVHRIKEKLDDRFEVIITNEIKSPVNIYVSSLERVIENITSNISKYADDNCEVKIRISKKNNYIELEVLNGSMENYSDICDSFTERFFRADDSRALNNGYGLGLSICKNIMEANNGYLRIEAIDKFVIVKLGFEYEDIK